MHFFYRIGIFLYGFSIRLAAVFNSKAKKWIDGRRKWAKKLQAATENAQNVIWFHCASLGEFEQGRPLIEKIKSEQKDVFILLSFFSPSGYEIRKNYDKADYVCYLPLDTKKNAQKWLKIAGPNQVFIVKYEFWANYLFCLQRAKIPTYSMSAIFRKEQHFFRRKTAFSQAILKSFAYFFVQNEESKRLLQSIGFHNVDVTGDTRYDRVLANAQNVQINPIIEKFCSKQNTLILGSSWPIDENLLLPLINHKAITEKVLIAPHEVHAKHLDSVVKSLNGRCLLFSKCTTETDFSLVQVLVLDCIGLLSSAYFFGSYAYVGGAFGKGLHNILEPAVFGLPVIFGPNHEKFPEAKQFIDRGIGFSIMTATQFLQYRTKIKDNHQELSEMTKKFIVEQQGATEKIYQKVFLNFPHSTYTTSKPT
jgi:3-deoxy-D-manno-octulosonic-acid transferase